MIKILFSFSMIFSFFCLSAQEKDTDADGVLDKDDACPKVKGVEKYLGCPDPTKPDCTNLQKEEKLLFDKFKRESQSVDYSGLPAIIFSKIDFKKFKSHNLLISLEI